MYPTVDTGSQLSEGLMLELDGLGELDIGCQYLSQAGRTAFGGPIPQRGLHGMFSVFPSVTRGRLPPH